MSRFPKLLLAAPLVVAALAQPAVAGKFGLGREALPEEIAAWDVDVSPDGTGLPVGSGSVLDGEELFSSYCAVCHGEFAEGVDNWPKLSGGEGTLADKDPLKTVGSYWPHLTTTLDYINRSMPFGNAQTLSNDEVYAVLAYILYSNYLVEEDFVLTDENLLDIELPNADGFIVDDRPETEYPLFSQEPCMENCKDEVAITRRAAVLDVTPEETKARQIQEMISATNPNSRVQQTAATEEVAEAPAETATEESLDPELVAAGGKVFKKCAACHQVGQGAKNRTGPLLNGVVGRAAGAVDGFKYSNPMKDAAGAGLVWTEEELTAFLANPRSYMKGTKMSFNGLKNADDLKAVIAYLQSQAE